MPDNKTKRNILIQLDSDAHPSVFDRVVAVDSGVDELFSYGNVAVDDVEGLVHGAMFTRGPNDLKHTAIFVGGGDVATGEQLLERVRKTFFGPLSVSVMLDANGANTTAAAAVLAAQRHLDLSGATALVLGGTGPVGRRAALLLAGRGAKVKLSSRSQQRAAEAAQAIDGDVEPVTGAPLGGVQLVIAAGAAGVRLLSMAERTDADSLRVAIDLNAVPPAGIEGIEVTHKAVDQDGVICYGAIGVGGTKMKIHKAAIAALFASNDQVFDAEAIYAIGRRLESPGDER
jgi:hypothetical protein